MDLFFCYLFLKALSFSVNLVHTGSMDLVHLSSSLGQEADSFFKSPVFNAVKFGDNFSKMLWGMWKKFEQADVKNN